LRCDPRYSAVNKTPHPQPLHYHVERRLRRLGLPRGARSHFSRPSGASTRSMPRRKQIRFGDRHGQWLLLCSSAQNIRALLIGLECATSRSFRQSVGRPRRTAKMRAWPVTMPTASMTFSPRRTRRCFIHFPDPWPRNAIWKHRLIQEGFLAGLFELQRPGSHVEFKNRQPRVF